MAILLAVTMKEPEPVAGLNPEVTPEVSRVVGRCLEKLPGARYANGQEIAEALGAVVSEPSASAPSGRRSGGAAVSPAAASLLTPEAASMPAKAARRRSRWLVLVGACVICLGGALGLRLRSDPRGSVASAHSTAAPTPTTLSDLPQPASTVPEAIGEYKSGLQFLRDDSFDNARQRFEHAASLDHHKRPLRHTRSINRVE